VTVAQAACPARYGRLAYMDRFLTLSRRIKKLREQAIWPFWSILYLENVRGQGRIPDSSPWAHRTGSQQAQVGMDLDECA
jgi:hypothetical protein